MTVGDLLLTLGNNGVLLAVLILAAIITGVVFLVSLIAYHRRRSRQYLLVSIALFALWFRSVVGALTVLDILPMYHHHLIEHGLDAVIGVLILIAVYAYAPGRFRSE